SGEKATVLTKLVCPVSGPTKVCPLCELQTRINSSSEPEAMSVPSGENATELTSPSCMSGPTTVRPVVPSIMYTEDETPNAISDPSGEKQADSGGSSKDHVAKSASCR